MTPGQIALKLSKLLGSRPQSWRQTAMSVSKLQEQLSELATERAAVEQRLQVKTAEVVCLHDKATASAQQSHDLKTRTPG